MTKTDPESKPASPLALQEDFGPPASIKLGERPQYDPITMPEIVIKLSRFGKSRAQIAAHLGLSRKALEEWERTYPKFAEALDIGDTLALAWWEGSGQLGIFLGSKDFNNGAWLSQIRARYPDLYREVTAHELTGKNGGPIETQNIGEAEAIRRVATALNDALRRSKARAEAQTIEAHAIQPNGRVPSSTQH